MGTAVVDTQISGEGVKISGGNELVAVEDEAYLGPSRLRASMCPSCSRGPFYDGTGQGEKIRTNKTTE